MESTWPFFCSNRTTALLSCEYVAIKTLKRTLKVRYEAFRILSHLVLEIKDLSSKFGPVQFLQFASASIINDVIVADGRVNLATPTLAKFIPLIHF